MKLLTKVALLVPLMISINGPIVSESATLETEIKDSHFYGLALSEAPIEGNFQWVSNYKSDYIIAMSRDEGFTDGENALLGANSPTHELVLLNSLNGETKKLGSVSYPKTGKQKFRTLDIVHNPFSMSSAEINFYVAFTSADSNFKCRRVNVYEYSGSELKSNPEQAFTARKVFSTPCFPATDTGDYRLHMSGGRIALIEPGKWKSKTTPEFYLSIGDFIKSDANTKNLPSNTRNFLGSVVHVVGSTGKVVANGLRNPQGLAQVFVGKNEILIETEHGPRGGDELNQINSGSKYGWPKYSYGTAYEPNDSESKPFNEGKSGNSRTPLFSWVPSVAPSQILQNKGVEFKEWWRSSTAGNYQGDLLMATLNAQSIFRIRIEDNRVVYVEQIPVGYRIRSFIQTPRGRLILGTDQGKVVVIQKATTWDSKVGDFTEK